MFVVYWEQISQFWIEELTTNEYVKEIFRSLSTAKIGPMICHIPKRYKIEDKLLLSTQGSHNSL